MCFKKIIDIFIGVFYLFHLGELVRRDGKEIRLRQKDIWGQLKRWLIVLTKDGRSGEWRKDWRFTRRRQVLAPVEKHNSK